MNWSKLMSRKFWITTAAFLASLATSIAGITSANETVTTVGIVCGVLSAAIYAAAEAYVDAASATANGDAMVTTKTVTATASDKATVQAVMGTTEQREA